MFEFPRDIIPQRCHPTIPTPHFPDVPLIRHAYNLQMEDNELIVLNVHRENYLSCIRGDNKK